MNPPLFIANLRVHDVEISKTLLTKSIRLAICSSGNGLDCFENLKELDNFRRKVFRKVFKKFCASLSGIYHIDLHG